MPQKVWTQVSQLKERDGQMKIGLTMIGVDQKTGECSNPPPSSGGFGGGGGGAGMCYAFRDGNCTRGDSCRYSHEGGGGGGSSGQNDDLPKLGAVIKCRVKNICDFGAFAGIEGCMKDGAECKRAYLEHGRP